MDSSNHRKRNSSEPETNLDNKRSKAICKYGATCFRRNPAHLLEYSHPHLEKLITFQSDNGTTSLPNNLPSSYDQKVIKDQLQIIRESEKVEKTSNSSNQQTSSGESTSTVKVVKETSNNRLTKQESEENIVMVESTSKNDINQRPSLSSSSSSNTRTEVKKTCAKYDIHDYCPVVAPKGQFAKKLANAAPYNIFYTTITDSSITHYEPLSVTFQELLDRSLGELQASIQINFMVDVSWLLAQYIFAGYRNKPLMILYGADDDNLATISTKIPTVTSVKIRMADAFGTHHTKIMLFSYEDGSMRVVVSTANLYEDDWHNRVQGLWISPTCSPLSDSEGANSDEGNGPTNFKKDLLNYLNSYKLPVLQEWIGRVRRTDFSHINVFLVASVPGTHRAADFDKYGHTRMASLLSKYCTIPTNIGWNPSDWSILCQCSSIGSLGPKPDAWLCGQIRTSFSRMKQKMLMSAPSISLIYPSFENVKQSHDHLLGGGCLPYTRAQHEKQTWLHNYLCQWKAASKHRNQAMPHIKTYCRISPDLARMAWFLLTSANLSKAAWGNCPMSSVDKRITIRSYEVGVLFIPEFVTKKESFLLDTGDIEISEEETKNYFPFPYDLPLTPFEKNDIPFFMDILQGK